MKFAAESVKRKVRAAANEVEIISLIRAQFNAAKFRRVSFGGLL